jgi:hypothetical protein
MGLAEGTSRVASSVRKKRPARVFFAALLSIVVYFVLFPYPLGRELVVHPRWATPVPSSAAPAILKDSPQAASAPDNPRDTTAPFQLGDVFGYVQGDGSILYLGKTQYRIALSATGFVNYTRLGTDWILQDTSGRPVSSFSGSGYPFLGPEGNRIFNVKSDLSGLIELDRNGRALWERDFPTLMTAASLQGDLLLVGLLNGSLVLLDRKGMPLFEYPPKGSRIPVIVGDAVAPDGSLLAAVSGIGPQYLTVLRRQNAMNPRNSAALGYTATAVVILPSEYRREVRIAFSPDSRCLVLEGKGGPGLFDPSRGVLRWVSLRGTLAGTAWLDKGKLAAMACRDGGRAQLAIEPASGVLVYREEFPARELYLATIEGQLLLGWDGQLLRVDVEPI